MFSRSSVHLPSKRLVGPNPHARLWVVLLVRSLMSSCCRVPASSVNRRRPLSRHRLLSKACAGFWARFPKQEARSASCLGACCRSAFYLYCRVSMFGHSLRLASSNKALSNCSILWRSIFGQAFRLVQVARQCRVGALATQGSCARVGLVCVGRRLDTAS